MVACTTDDGNNIVLLVRKLTPPPPPRLEWPSRRARTTRRLQGEPTRIYVTLSMRLWMVRDCCHANTSCHLGVAWTLRILERFYWCVGMDVCTRWWLRRRFKNVSTHGPLVDSVTAAARGARHSFERRFLSALCRYGARKYRLRTYFCSLIASAVAFTCTPFRQNLQHRARNKYIGLQIHTFVGLSCVPSARQWTPILL